MEFNWIVILLLRRSSGFNTVMIGILIRTAGNIHQPQKQIVVEIHDHLFGTVVAGKMNKAVFRPRIVHQIAHDLRLSAAEPIDGLLDVADAEDISAAGN